MALFCHQNMLIAISSVTLVSQLITSANRIHLNWQLKIQILMFDIKTVKQVLQTCQ